MNDISAANASFWNELCGTNAARSLGITDASPAALARFDQWYFERAASLAARRAWTLVRSRSLLPPVK